MKTGKLIYKSCLIYGRYGHCQVWVRHSPKSYQKVEDNFWTHICQLATTTNHHPAHHFWSMKDAPYKTNAHKCTPLTIQTT